MKGIPIKKYWSNFKEWSVELPNTPYSNVGYSLLAIIIEKISGMNYEEYVELIAEDLANILIKE